MAEIADLINFALEKNPVEFAEAFNSIVQARAVDAIEARKIEMASSLYSEADESEYEALLNDDEVELDLEGEDDEA